MSNLHSAAPPDRKSLGRFWTIPNMLSLSRIALTVPITYLIWVDGDLTLLLVLIFVAVSTDWFDGVLARRLNTVSEWGKILDPLADKFAASAVVLVLVLKNQLPLWFLLVILVRDVLILAGGAIAAHRLRVVLVSMWWGKVAVFMLALTILWVILEADPPVYYVSLWITTVLFVYSFILYVIRFFHILFGDDEVDEDAEPVTLLDETDAAALAPESAKSQ